MDYTRASTYETPFATTDANWNNVWSLPIVQDRPYFIELNAVARSATAVACWGRTGIFRVLNGLLDPVLAGDGMREIFTPISSTGAGVWDIRVQFTTDSHLNVDVKGAAGVPIDWVVRLEAIQWPDLGQFSIVAGRVL